MGIVNPTPRQPEAPRPYQREGVEKQIRNELDALRTKITQPQAGEQRELQYTLGSSLLEIIQRHGEIPKSVLQNFFSSLTHAEKTQLQGVLSGDTRLQGLRDSLRTIDPKAPQPTTPVDQLQHTIENAVGKITDRRNLEELAAKIGIGKFVSPEMMERLQPTIIATIMRIIANAAENLSKMVGLPAGKGIGKDLHWRAALLTFQASAEEADKQKLKNASELARVQKEWEKQYMQSKKSGGEAPDITSILHAVPQAPSSAVAPTSKQPQETLHRIDEGNPPKEVTVNGKKITVKREWNGTHSIALDGKKLKMTIAEKTITSIALRIPEASTDTVPVSKLELTMGDGSITAFDMASIAKAISEAPADKKGSIRIASIDAKTHLQLNI